MPRLPDIPLNSWLEDQQKRFREATDGLFPALDFERGAKATEAAIPPDFDAPGGMDQWQEAEKKNLEEQYREQQRQSEERRQQEIQAQADQYAQQQQQAEQARQAQTQERESSVMDQIRAMGIPLPGDVFGTGAADPGADNTSTTGLLDQAPSPVAGPVGEPAPPSEVDQFNSHASGLMTDMFGMPESAIPQSDNTSTTGLLDRLGSVASGAGQAIRQGADQLGSAIESSPLYEAAKPGMALATGVADPIGAARNVERAAGYLVDNYGAGKLDKDFTRERELEQVDRPLTPEETEELRAIKENRDNIVMGASGTMGGGGLAGDAIAAIKALRAAGLEEAALVAERNLAEKSPLTLAEIQKQTQGLVESVLPKGETPAENAPSAVFDETPTGKIELPSQTPDPLTPPTGPPETRGLTADEARQMKLPGFEDLVPENRAGEPGVRGFGQLPESLTPGESGGMTRETEQAVRSRTEALSEGQRPFTFEERRAAVAEMIQADPDAVGRVLAQAQTADPRLAGIHQEMMKNNVRRVGDAWDLARQEFFRVRDELGQILDTPGGGAPSKELLAELAYRGSQFQSLSSELSMAVKGQTLTAKAASQIMNAQRGGRLGAYAIGEANIVQDVAATAGKAAEAARKVAGGGAVDEGVLGPLRQLQTKLNGKRARRAVTGESNLQGDLDAFERVRNPNSGRKGGGGGRPPGAAGAAPTPKPPSSETLAERLGRLKREQGRLEDSGASETDLNQIRYQIDEVMVQAREEMTRTIRDQMERRAIDAENLPAPTVEELDRIVNESIGRKALSRIKGEVTSQAKGYETPAVQAQKFSVEMERAIDKALLKHTADTERLQRSIDAQIQRRVDGMLAQEKRAAVRAEVKTMAQKAQVWADRIRKMPDQPGLEEEFDQILREMSDHSNVGERVANDLRERLGVNISEDAFIRTSNEERKAAQAISESRIRGVSRQIKDVLDNPHAPDRAARISGLYQDLAAINADGLKKAQGMRQRAYESGIMKSGLFADDANHAVLVDMVRAIDPKNPATFRPILETMVRPNLWQVWREISFINMLSSPVTHLTNITSTAANGALKLFIRNPLEQLFSGGESSGSGAAIRGLLEGTGKGWTSAKQAFRTGINPDKLENVLASGDLSHVGRELVPMVARQAGGQLEKLGLKGAANAMGKMGELLHIQSTRPLEAMDGLMGHMMYSSEAARLAQQKADMWIKTGSSELAAVRDPSSTLSLRDQAMRYIFDNIWDHPEIIKEAGKVEDYTLFRSKSPEGVEKALRQLMSVKEVGPDGTKLDHLKAGLIDFIMPFYNVPFNFTKQGLGNMVAPLGALAAPGKYMAGDKKAGAELLAKAVQGGAMMTIPTLLAMDDNITFTGPKDAGDRRIWAESHKPMSWRLPGTKQWISYEGTPWAIPFASVAGGYEALQFSKTQPSISDLDRYGQAAVGFGSGAARGALSQAFMEGAIKNFELITGQSTGADAVAQGVAGAIGRYSPHVLIAPVGGGMLNFLAQVKDSVDRDPGKVEPTAAGLAQGVQDKLEQRIPFLRENLPVRRGAFGEEVPRTLPLPLYRGRAVNDEDPIAAQLQKGSVGIPDAPKEVPMGKGSMPLTIAEQKEFQRVWGESYRQALEEEGAGKTTMTDRELTAIRNWARKRAFTAVVGTLSDAEIDRRWQDKPPVEVAP